MRYILFILLGMICSLAHAEETFKNPIFYQPLKSWAHGFRSTKYLTPTTSRIVGDGYDTLTEGCVLIEDTGSSIILGCPHYAGTMYERYVNVGNPNRAQRKAMMERDGNITVEYMRLRVWIYSELKQVKRILNTLRHRKCRMEVAVRQNLILNLNQ